MGRKNQMMIYGLLLIMLTNSCTSVQSVLPFPVSVSKEACKGKCPVYKIIILKSGEVDFEGVKNTKHTGRSKVLLSKKEFQELKQVYKTINLSKLKNSYDQRIYDLPQTVIKNSNNSVSFKRNQSVPIELIKFVELLDEILKKNNLL